MASRIEFIHIMRSEGESVLGFTKRLKETAQLAQFKNDVEERLRDQFIAGIRFPKLEVEIRSKYPRMLDETGRNLTFDKILDMALAWETAESEINSLNINLIRDNRRGAGVSKSQTDPNRTASKCFRCGRSHIRNYCAAATAKCFNCNRMGHFSRACKNKRINQVFVDCEEDFGDINSINQIKKSDRRRATIDATLNDVRFRFEYDTGAQVSVINECIWNQIGKPKLRPTHNFTGYGHQKLGVLGETTIKVGLGQTSKLLPAIVTKIFDVPLFGLPWILSFGLYIPKCVKIFKVYQLGTIPNQDSNTKSVNLIKKLAGNFDERTKSDMVEANSKKRGKRLKANTWQDANEITYQLNRQSEFDMAEKNIGILPENDGQLNEKSKAIQTNGHGDKNDEILQTNAIENRNLINADALPKFKMAAKKGTIANGKWVKKDMKACDDEPTKEEILKTTAETIAPNDDRTTRPRNLEREELVWVKNRLTPRWREGKVLAKTGWLSYSVNSNNKVLPKHAGQFRKRGEEVVYDQEIPRPEPVEPTRDIDTPEVKEDGNLRRENRPRKPPRELKKFEAG